MEEAFLLPQEFLGCILEDRGLGHMTKAIPIYDMYPLKV